MTHADRLTQPTMWHSFSLFALLLYDHAIVSALRCCPVRWCSLSGLAFCNCSLSGKIGSHLSLCVNHDFSGTAQRRSATNSRWNSYVSRGFESQIGYQPLTLSEFWTNRRSRQRYMDILCGGKGIDTASSLSIRCCRRWFYPTSESPLGEDTIKTLQKSLAPITPWNFICGKPLKYFLDSIKIDSNSGRLPPRLILQDNVSPSVATEPL